MALGNKGTLSAVRQDMEMLLPAVMQGRKHAGLAALGLLVACVPASNPPRPVATVRLVPVPVAPRPVAPISREDARLRLAASIMALGGGFDGSVGISVRGLSDGWSSGYAAGLPRPQQSVSKLWVAMTVLDAVDRGAMSLNDSILILPSGLTLFHRRSATWSAPPAIARPWPICCAGR